jgi:hypothetical protein
MGLAIAAILAIDLLRETSSGSRVAALWQWLGFGVAALVAVFVTPYGAQPLMLSLSMAQGHEAVPFMDEWQPLEFSTLGIAILTAAGVAILALLMAPRVQFGRILLVGFLTYATLRHTRFAMVLALVTPILAGEAIGYLIRRINKKLGIFQDTPDQVPNWLVGGTVAAALLAATWFFVSRPVQPVVRVYPTAALASVPPEMRREHVFNSYEYGGFLIGQGVKTFIDGRSDQLFLGGFITRVVEATRGGNPSTLGGLLDEYVVRWSLVSQKRPETALFRKMDDWRLHFEDENAAVFVRK